MHSCITQLQPVPALRTHQMEGSHIVSYAKEVCCVFRRCNRAITDYKKTGLQTKNPPDICEFIQSFVRSFTHLFVPQILWQYMGLRLNKKINSQPSPPNQSCDTDGNRHTIFWKAPGSVKHDVFTAKRRYITLLSNVQDARDTVLQRARLDKFNVVWD